MKIISLTAENVKKLVAVEITPDGNMVQITGKNRQGKTSVLDAIWWAIAGTENIQRQPIRQGQDKARIELHLGDHGKTELIVERRITEKSSTLAVKTAEGAKYPSPQRMLDDLLGALTFDPLAFMRKDERGQFDVLRKLVPLKVDLDEIDLLNKQDYAKRTDLNRTAKQHLAAAQSIAVPEGLPEEPVDINALLNQMTEASEHNADIERRRANREQAVKDIEAGKAFIDGMHRALPDKLQSVENARDRIVSDYAAQIEILQRKIEAAKQEADEEAKRLVNTFKQQTSERQANIEELRSKLTAAGELPDPVDVAALRAQIDEANEINAGISSRVKRNAELVHAEHAQIEAQKRTDAMEARNQSKLEAIDQVEMPVSGLGFGDGIVLYNGVPLDQASDAEQLEVSMAIAAALNPKLRVLRIRDGSLLDDDAMERLAKFADERDFQVWIERVDSSGTVGIVMEDGHVRGQEPVTQAAE